MATIKAQALAHQKSLTMTKSYPRLTAPDDPNFEFWVTPLPKLDTSKVQLEVASLSTRQTVDHVNFKNKRVLVRVDYNVPLSSDGQVEDPSRIEATLETLRYILSQKPRALVLICHLGRPGGQGGPEFTRLHFSLSPVAEKLQEYLPKHKVKFLPESVGPRVEDEIRNCEHGTVFLLENLRFHVEETGKGVTSTGKTVKADKGSVERFKDALSQLGDVFVFEAFGAAHRPHASVVGIKAPQRVAGRLMQKELSVYAEVLGKPKKPFLCIIGGSKVSDKIKVMQNMMKLVDEMIIAGGMAYTFKKVVDGIEIGASLFDKEGADLVPAIMREAKDNNVQLHFPVDHVIASSFSNEAEATIVTDQEGIPQKHMALDIGPLSRERFSGVIGRARTILWNGPLGVFEFDKFALGTKRAMEDFVKAAKNGAVTVIGGGDTGHAARKIKVDGKIVAEQITHCSTGGGSSLVLMEGKALPAVTHLSDVKDLAPNGIDFEMIWAELQATKIKLEKVAIKAKDPVKPRAPQGDNISLFAMACFFGYQMSNILKTLM